MKQFNWSEFKDTKNKIVVHCKTEEEAKDFCKQMHEHGMKWSIGDSYLKYNCFKVYKDNTCYSSIGEFSDVDSYKNLGCTILEWSDYMQKEFTKADLKDGMVVELNCGTMALKIGDEIACSTSCFSLDAFNSDLMHLNYSASFDIAKVYRVKSVRRVNDIFQKDFLELIWERTETKRMTVEEMKAKLEELLGEKIEVEYKADRFEMIGELYCYCDSINGYCRGCELKSIHEKYGCNFENHPEDTLKQCYEKVIADGR